MGTRAPYADQHNGGGREGKGLRVLKLTMKQRQEKWFEQLDLSRLESWPPQLVDSAQSILAEYHNVFSLEPSELGCTHLMNM